MQQFFISQGLPTDYTCTWYEISEDRDWQHTQYKGDLILQFSLSLVFYQNYCYTYESIQFNRRLQVPVPNTVWGIRKFPTPLWSRAKHWWKVLFLLQNVVRHVLQLTQFSIICLFFPNERTDRYYQTCPNVVIAVIF